MARITTNIETVGELRDNLSVFDRSLRLSEMITGISDSGDKVTIHTTPNKNNELARVTPDGRNNGKFQFESHYPGGFSMAYIHLTFEEVEARLQGQHPSVPSKLIDDGKDLVLVRETRGDLCFSVDPQWLADEVIEARLCAEKEADYEKEFNAGYSTGRAGAFQELLDEFKSLTVSSESESNDN